MTKLYTHIADAVADKTADEQGSVAAEYGLLIAGIAVVMGAAAALLGGRIVALFDSVTF